MTENPSNMGAPMTVGVVVIGRNEGERLRRCLGSLNVAAMPVVYVDSGSTDGSCDLARAMGCEVIELDLSIPFTAARARNAGLARLRELGPPEYVQFIDGDCELHPDWLPAAREFLENNPEVAVVAGRRREFAPDASIWNRMCDQEWNTPIGRAAACGGDSLMRYRALDAVGGFRADLIAGEEPELCLRLARAGWSIWRLDQDMTSHDAAMTRFVEWWKRMVRGGWAIAEGWALHGDGPEQYNLRMLVSTLLWSVVIPLIVVACVVFAATLGPAILWSLVAVILVLAYPAMMVRIAGGRQRYFGDEQGDALTYGVFTMIGKFANLAGVLRYIRHRFAGGRARLIEYKGPQKSQAHL